MRKSAEIITALSVAGLAVAAGSAFTGTGLATTDQAASAQFVDGTVSQSVTGATLTTIAYGYVDAGPKTLVNSITLTEVEVARFGGSRCEGARGGVGGYGGAAECAARSAGGCRRDEAAVRGTTESSTDREASHVPASV